MDTPFEIALAKRVEEMTEACTRCGKCVEACPLIAPAGINASAPDLIAGVIDILRTGAGPTPSRTWASVCALSGECIQACDEGINPRFLLAMARAAMVGYESDRPTRRKRGIDDFRKVSRDVGVLSRLQLTSEMLDRLGQRTGTSHLRDGTNASEPPDFVFYTGCNVLKTPHIVLLALDLLDALGVTYAVMGGPSHCCGVVQFRTGDLETSGRMAEMTLQKLARGRSGRVLSWCASCHVQFDEFTLTAHEQSGGGRPFEMTPFMTFLRSRLDQLVSLMRYRVDLRVALHCHPGLSGVMEAAAEILGAVPGVEIVDLRQPAIGLMSNYLRTLPDYKRQLQHDELEAARTANVDALVTVYHPDHRELCAYERSYPFRIINLLEVVGASIGFSRDDRFKRLKKLQDVELILAETRDLLRNHDINEQTARSAIQAMLDEQPLALDDYARPATMADDDCTAD